MVNYENGSWIENRGSCMLQKIKQFEEVEILKIQKINRHKIKKKKKK